MFGEAQKQLVFIGNDHAGFKAKEELKKFLQSENYDVTDLGCFSEEPVDYPDIAGEVSEKVLEHDGAFGILLCGTGIGMSMAANRLYGIRAALATDENLAELSRQHNNANVLTMGARTTDVEKMKKIAMKFLKTSFLNEERHVRRIAEMDKKMTNKT